MIYTPVAVFLALLLFAAVLCIYGFCVRDRQLYSDILAAYFDSVIFMILGYNVYGGVIYSTNPTELIWQSEIYAGLFIVWGVFMIGFAVFRTYFTVQEIMDKLKTPAWKLRAQARRDGRM